MARPGRGAVPLLLFALSACGSAGGGNSSPRAAPSATPIVLTNETSNVAAIATPGRYKVAWQGDCLDLYLRADSGEKDLLGVAAHNHPSSGGVTLYLHSGNWDVTSTDFVALGPRDQQPPDLCHGWTVTITPSG